MNFVLKSACVATDISVSSFTYKFVSVTFYLGQVTEDSLLLVHEVHTFCSRIGTVICANY